MKTLNEFLGIPENLPEGMELSLVRSLAEYSDLISIYADSFIIEKDEADEIPDINEEEKEQFDKAVETYQNYVSQQHKARNDVTNFANRKLASAVSTWTDTIRDLKKEFGADRAKQIIHKVRDCCTDSNHF